MLINLIEILSWKIVSIYGFVFFFHDLVFNIYYLGISFLVNYNVFTTIFFSMQTNVVQMFLTIKHLNAFCLYKRTQKQIYHCSVVYI